MRTTLTIDQIVEEWYKNADVLRISKDSYRKKLHYWFRWLHGSKIDVRSPERAHLLDYKTSLQNRSLRESTVDSYLKAVKSFYTYCESERYYENIATGIKMSRRRYVHAKRALSEIEATRLISSVSTKTELGLRDKIIISLMICNGLRAVEVERLRVSDWSIEEILKIKRKGRIDKQQVRISKEIDEMIAEYMSCRSQAEPSDPLLINHSNNRRGKQLNRQSVSKMIKERMRKIGIDSGKVTAHSLRHTCAQLLFNNGVPVEDVQLILGHTNLSTTKIYLGDVQHERLLDNSPCILLTERLFNGTKQAEK